MSQGNNADFAFCSTVQSVPHPGSEQQFIFWQFWEADSEVKVWAGQGTSQAHTKTYSGHFLRVLPRSSLCASVLRSPLRTHSHGKRLIPWPLSDLRQAQSQPLEDRPSNEFSEDVNQPITLHCRKATPPLVVVFWIILLIFWKLKIVTHWWEKLILISVLQIHFLWGKQEASVKLSILKQKAFVYKRCSTSDCKEFRSCFFTFFFKEDSFFSELQEMNLGL